MSDNLTKYNSGKLHAVIAGVIVGTVTTLALMLISAAAIYLFNLDRAYSIPLSTLSLALGGFAAAYYVARKSERKGYLVGALTGLISFALVTIISLIVTKSGLTVNTLFHFIIITLASVIGGIMGVNKGKNKKLI